MLPYPRHLAEAQDEGEMWFAWEFVEFWKSNYCESLLFPCGRVASRSLRLARSRCRLACFSRHRCVMRNSVLRGSGTNLVTSSCFVPVLARNRHKTVIGSEGSFFWVVCAHMRPCRLDTTWRTRRPERAARGRLYVSFSL